jgi:hypothetical protein
MSEHYHDAGDMRFLKEMGKLAPTEFKAWLGLDDIVRREDGAIPRKYRELIALGVHLRLNVPTASKGTLKVRKRWVRLAKKSRKLHLWLRPCALEERPLTAPWR